MKGVAKYGKRLKREGAGRWNNLTEKWVIFGKVCR